MANDNKNSKWNYWVKAFKWFSMNLCFGLFPLYLMYIVKTSTNGKAGNPQVDHLVYEGGIVLFVCIASMGAVMIDYVLSGIPKSGFRIFRIYIVPLILLGYVTLDFLLICMDKLEKETFSLTSSTTIIIFLLAFVYCTFTKANLYLEEDSHDNI